MELTVNTQKEINKLNEILINSRDDLTKRFTNLFEDLIDTAARSFESYIESEATWAIENHIKTNVNSIVEGLLAGETKYLAYQQIISDYNWEHVHKIRMAIWEAAGQDIEACIINKLKK